LVMNRTHFITGRLEQDKLIGFKACTDRIAALTDLRQRARINKVIDWPAKEE
jgi:hypothetical protein